MPGIVFPDASRRVRDCPPRESCNPCVLVGQRRVVPWVVNGSRFVSHRLPPASEIRASVDEYNGLIMSGRDPLTSELPAGDKLLRILVSPALRKSGPAIVSWLFLTAASISLNFEALPVRSRLLITGSTMSGCRVTPSLALFASGTGHRLATTSILMIGDPEEADKKVQLRFVQSEMQDIVGALPAAEKVVYRGAQARPHRVPPIAACAILPDSLRRACRSERIEPARFRRASVRKR